MVGFLLRGIAGSGSAHDVGQFVVPDGFERVYATVAGLRAFIFADVVAGISLVTLGIAAGVQLVRIKANAVRLANIYLACYVAYAVFELVAPFVFGLPADWIIEMATDGPKEFGRAGIYVAIWATYLRKSKRVAGTYGHLRLEVQPKG